MSKRVWLYIGFFVLLVIGFFVFLSYSIPGFAHPKFPPIGTVQTFSFENQEGKTVTNEDVNGKVYVATFFFTTCTSVCPRLNNNLRPVYAEFREQPDFKILSFTCDPSRDSVQRLKWYSDSIMHVDANKWVFLTGNKDSLYAMARHSYMIDDPRNEVQSGETDFLHTQLIALVNKNGEVVKVYDGLKPSEIKQMQVEIKKLLNENS
jgi:protein SCO1